MTGADDAASQSAASPHRAAPPRIVVSSITGQPMRWEDAEAVRALRPDDAPIIPDRLRDEGPEPGSDESNDQRIAGDIPPHWGRGA